MSEINDIFKRIKIEELAPYFLYGGESIVESTMDYEQRVKESFRNALKSIEELCADTGENDEEIEDILSEFSSVYSDVYLQIGVLIGFQLFKVLEQDFCKAKAMGIESVLKQYTDLFSKDAVKNIIPEEK